MASAIDRIEDIFGELDEESEIIFSEGSYSEGGSGYFSYSETVFPVAATSRQENEQFDEDEFLEEEEEEGLCCQSCNITSLMTRQRGRVCHIISYGFSSVQLRLRTLFGVGSAQVLKKRDIESLIQSTVTTDPGKGNVQDETYSTSRRPFEVLKSILGLDEELGCIVRPSDTIGNGYFVPWDTTDYALATDAVRNGDLKKVRELQKAGKNLQSSNNFGESIVHTAARRGQFGILRFLTEEAGVSLKVCCDSGRTPLHDACWTSTPNFACVRFILNKHPEFLFIADRRGFTPLQYAPNETWGEWGNFLEENREVLEELKK